MNTYGKTKVTLVNMPLSVSTACKMIKQLRRLSSEYTLGLLII